MTALVLGLVSLGVALTVGLAVLNGFDTTTVVFLGLIVIFGAMAVAVTRMSSKGSIVPTPCANCGGLISPSAPYCKHCKTPVTDP